MRVLHVVDSARRRGAEVFAADLIRALNSRGVEQHVALLEPHPREIEYEAPTAPLPGSGAVIPGFLIRLRTVRGLRELIRRVAPDVVQAHGGDTLKYTALAGIGLDTPLIHRGIGLHPDRITRGMRRRVYRLLMMRGTRIVALADEVRRQLAEVFEVPIERLVKIPNAVDPQRLRIATGRRTVRRSLRIPNEAPVTVSVGAFTWEKDPLAHVEVIAGVVRRAPASIHLMVGDGPLRSDVQDHILRHGLGDRVRLLGVRNDVHEILSASDLLVLVSRIEGMPTCAIEAGMCGLPVAGYAVAGLPEVVLDGVTGHLVAPGDLKGMVATVSDLLADGARRAALGAAARRHSQRFGIDSVARQYLELYAQVGAT